MLTLLIVLTAVICAAGPLVAYFRYRDIFHPLILISPMCAFLYVYMPVKLIQSSDLLTFVTLDQAEFYQFLVVLVLAAMFAGILAGSGYRQTDVTRPRFRVDRKKLHRGAYFFGGIGFLAFAYTIHNAGG